MSAPNTARNAPRAALLRRPGTLAATVGAERIDGFRCVLLHSPSPRGGSDRGHGELRRPTLPQHEHASP